MAPPVRTSRELWIDTGRELLATEGAGAVRVEVLAQRLGVTRGGFYRQFGSRADLVDAMLDAWERRSIDDVMAQLRQHSGDAEMARQLSARLLQLQAEHARLVAGD